MAATNAPPPPASRRAPSFWTRTSSYLPTIIILLALSYHFSVFFLPELWPRSENSERVQDPSIDSSRVFTLAELRQFDGSDPALPILLSFMGRVYDVSAGPQFYGPKGGYKFFAGRDGTRGFLTGCFEPDCLLPDLDGLPEDQIKGLESWTKTYTRKYIRVGVLHEDERRCTPEQLEKARELERKSKR